MQLDALVVAFPHWGTLPLSRVAGNARRGKPVVRTPAVAGSIRARRIALGLTQALVADRLGINRETLIRLEQRPRYERGVRSDVVRLRGRVNALYLELERARDADQAGTDTRGSL